MGEKLKIGVLLGNTETEYCHELSLGIEHSAKELGHTAVLFSVAEQNEVQAEEGFEDKLYSDAAESGLDMYIVSLGTIGDYLSSYGESERKFLSRFDGKPILVLESRVDGYESICTDNIGGITQCLTHLISECSYSKIAFLAGKKDNFDSNKRLGAYRKIMEENGLSVKEDMIAYGDFNSHCDSAVTEILDRCPDIEAIVCADDEMAKAAYREAYRRGLVVGSDIAVTGFDDLPAAKNMDPPLTTVCSNSYSMGYNAVYEVLRIYEGKSTIIKTITTEFRKRGSTGTGIGHKLFGDGESNLSELTRRFVSEILIRSGNIESGLGVSRYIRPLIEYILNYPADSTNISFPRNQLRRLLMGKFGDNVSADSLQQSLNCLLSLKISLSESQEAKAELMSLQNSTNSFITHFCCRSAMLREERIRREASLGTCISGEALCGADSESESVFEKIGMRIEALGIKRSWILLYGSSDREETERRLYLKCRCFEKATEVLTDKGKPTSLAEIIENEAVGESNFTALGIHLGGEQFGVFLAEGGAADFSKIGFACTQLGLAAKYLKLVGERNEIQNKLKKSNSLLSAQSNSDELTGLLNRRGFLRKIRSEIDISRDKKAVVVFCDIDNLKTINDSFGHASGDYAIKSAARILKKCFRSMDSIGRMGGDEFTALCIIDDTGLDGEEIIKRITEAQEDINRLSDKPFPTELSVGYTEFLCTADTNIGDILALADSKLYEAKKKKKVGR